MNRNSERIFTIKNYYECKKGKGIYSGNGIVSQAIINHSTLCCTRIYVTFLPIRSQIGNQWVVQWYKQNSWKLYASSYKVKIWIYIYLFEDTLDFLRETCWGGIHRLNWINTRWMKNSETLRTDPVASFLSTERKCKKIKVFKSPSIQSIHRIKTRRKMNCVMFMELGARWIGGKCLCSSWKSHNDSL